MRRFIPFLAALAILAGVAFGDEMQVNVVDFGAKADGITDNVQAFRKAIDAASTLVAGKAGTRAIVRVPGAANSYLTNRPISLDVPDVWIVGDGPQSRIQNIGVGPTIVVGVRDSEPGRTKANQPMTVQLPDEARPSRLGKLDGSFGGTAIRTMGTSSVVFYATPFDLGPLGADGGFSGWSVSTLAIDLAIERNADGGKWPEGKVEGIAMLGGYGSDPTFRLQKGGGSNTIDLLITDSAGNPGSVSIRVGNAPIKRISIQLDMAARKAYGWSDRVRVPITIGGPAFGPNGSGRLLSNKRDSMLIGAHPHIADGRPPLASQNADLPDWTYYGFSLSAYPKYRPDPVGSPQTSATNLTVNDAFAYGLGDGGKCVACLFGQTEANPGRRFADAFSGSNGFRAFYGYQIQRNQYLVSGGQNRNGIRGLQLIAPSKRMGPTLQLFSLLNFEARDCIISGGTQSVSIVPALATYPVRIRDCRLDAMDSCIAGGWCSVDVLDCDFDRVGRTAVNLWASDLTMDRPKLWFVSDWTDHIVANRGGLYGGHTIISNLVADFEEHPVAKSAFLVSQDYDLMTTLSVQDAYLANASRGKPLIKAWSAPNLTRPFSIDLSRIDTAGADPSTIIESDRPIPVAIDGKPSGNER